MEVRYQLMVRGMQLSTADGFTLIEMLLSVFIISLLMVIISFDLVTDVRRADVQAASLELQSILEGTRSCAIATNSNSSVTFNNNIIDIKCDREYQFVLKNVDVVTNFPNQVATFDRNGIINQGATIDVCNNQKCNKMTVGIGRSDVQIK